MKAMVFRSALALSLLLSLGVLPPGVPPAEALDTWVAQTSGTTVNLNGVTAPNASTAWAVGDVVPTLSGVSVKTTDGGGTWTNQSFAAAAGFSIFAVDAVDANIAWAVGSGGKIYKTADGANWTNQTSGITESVNAVAAVSSSIAWAAAGPSSTVGQVLKTTNGGDILTKLTFNLPVVQYFGVVGFDSNAAWVVGASGAIRVTTNGGSTWTTPTLTPASTSTQIFYATAVAPGAASPATAVGWTVGSGGKIYKTSDGGATWTGQTSGVAVDLRGVAAADASTAWAVGQDGAILKTTNGGTNWVAQTSDTTRMLRAVAAADAKIAWAVGDGGLILNTVPQTSVLRARVVASPAALCVVIDAPSPPVIDYGTVTLTAAKVSSPITARNCGGELENLSIQGAIAVATAASDTGWTLGPAPGVNVYVHGFADTATAPTFTPMTTAATSLITNVAAAGTKSFFLQLKTPTSTTGFGERTTTVTIIATVP